VKEESSSAQGRAECLSQAPNLDGMTSPVLDRMRSPASATALDLPDGLTLASWSALGVQLQSLVDSSAWWTGDWLIFGQDKYKDRYRHAMTETSLQYQTLRNYAWVARRFKPSRRREKLTFQHHVEVASLPDNDQDHWLDLAENFGWSRNELRCQIRNSSIVDQGPGETSTFSSRVTLSLDLKREQVQKWTEAAKRDNQDLAEWIGDILDQAV
jgi:hypothetical protein